MFDLCLNGSETVLKKSIDKETIEIGCYCRILCGVSCYFASNCAKLFSETSQTPEMLEEIQGYVFSSACSWYYSVAKLVPEIERGAQNQ